MAVHAADKRTAHRADGLAGADDLAEKLYESRLGNMKDIGKHMGLPDSDAANAPEIRQGIFARDVGPFLRGKGISHYLLSGTKGGAPQSLGPDTKAVMQPYHVSRCAGDELAFALFERLLEEKGFSDWRPDGIVLSKGADDPSDKLSDELLKSRDGELFNIRIQGPAVTSSWCGEPDMEVMPLDKMFVLIVADVWWGDLSPKNIPAGDSDAEKMKKRMWNAVANFVEMVVPANGSLPAEVPSSEMLRDYLKGRDQCLNCVTGEGLKKEQMESDTNDSFRRKQARAYQAGELTRLCNFRVKLATSSQMINFSAPRFDGVGNQVTEDVATDQFRRVHNQSRMGLRLGEHGGEYIVGGARARAFAHTHAHAHAHAHARTRTRAHTPQVGASATSSTRRRRVRPFLRPGPTSACARRPTRWPSTST